MPLDPVEHLVHNSAYNDHELFRDEMRRIKARIWCFVGHESEWPEVGSYRTTVVGGDPVVVVRGEDRELRAFYNVCRHRGAMVVDGVGKVARLLRCPYHWWTYDLSGNLAGVPGKASYECNDFAMSDFPLRGIRLETLSGLVFVTLATDGPSLEEFLGSQVCDIVRMPLEKADFEVAEARSFSVPANWKLIAENARDGYHVPFVHPLFRSVSPPGEYVLTDEGHAIQWTSIDESKLPEPLRESGMDFTLPGMERGQGFFLFIFPDLIMMARNNFFMISSSTPVSLKETTVERRVFGLVGDDEKQRQTRLTAATAFALDSYEHEDIPVLERQSRGLDNTGVPISVLARGEHATTGIQGDDNRLRQWWATWRDYMGLEYNAARSAADAIATWKP